MSRFQKYICFDNYDLKKTLKSIKKNGERCSIIVNKSLYLIGTVSDGDIRKRLISEKLNLNQNIKTVCNKKPKYLLENSYTSNTLKRLFLNNKYDIIPVVDKNRILKNIITKAQFIKTKGKKIKKIKSIKTAVVIMAGGFGNRMDPITKIIPKPLVPLKNQTVIEYITNSFFEKGFKNFFYSIGYKKDLIKAYFNDQVKKYKINFLIEKEPLGTAGGLRALKGKISDSFFVTNCDSVFDLDYKDLYFYHNKNDFDITVVVAKRKFYLPYGVCEITNKKKLRKIVEKPKFNFEVMTGMYVLNPRVLNLIPKKKFYNMNQLIDKSISKNLSVGSYLIGKRRWTDIGQLQEYKKNIKILSE